MVLGVNAAKMKRVVARKVVAPVGGAEPLVAELVGQLKHHWIQILELSEGKRKVAHGPPQRLLQLFAAEHDFVVQLARIVDSAQVGMGPAVGADFDPSRCQLADLLERIGLREETSSRVVRERLLLKHAATGDEIRAGIFSRIKSGRASSQFEA